jgi:hypothetical protein
MPRPRSKGLDSGEPPSSLEKGTPRESMRTNPKPTGWQTILSWRFGKGPARALSVLTLSEHPIRYFSKRKDFLSLPDFVEPSPTCPSPMAPGSKTNRRSRPRQFERAGDVPGGTAGLRKFQSSAGGSANGSKRPDPVACLNRRPRRPPCVERDPRLVVH